MNTVTLTRALLRLRRARASLEARYGLDPRPGDARDLDDLRNVEAAIETALALVADTLPGRCPDCEGRQMDELHDLHTAAANWRG